MTSLGDRYELIEVVGRWRGGDVVRAWDHQHGLPVALKIAGPGVDLSPEDERHRSLLSAPAHANLQMVRNDIVDGSQRLIVLDWIDGPTLAEILRDRGRGGLPPREVLGWLRQCASALDHLHGLARPVVHGRVQPANLVLTEGGRVVLVDLAEASPELLAPEVRSGGMGTPASDIYSLAATAALLVTGGIASAATGKQLAGWCQGLAVASHERPASAGELIAAVEDAAHLRDAAIDSWLVGRERDVEAVCDLVRRARLVTLTGPPGVGKSRLAAEVATATSRSFPEGTVTVSLGDAEDGQVATRLMARTIGVEARSPEELAGAAAGRVRSGETLLVVDDCDRVAEPVAAILARLLTECSGLHVLATSRIRLGVAGEQTYTVPPLSVTDARRLYRSRAGAELGDSAESLDGLPLAIELAAVADTSRTGGGGVVDAHPRNPLRHRSMQSAIDWSYDRLSAEERAVFGRLSALKEPFSLAAAEELVQVDAVVEVVLALVDKSLVIAEECDGELKYRLLEPLRQYGASRRHDPQQGIASP